MKGYFHLLVLALFGFVCSCSQKENTTPATIQVSAIILNPSSLTLKEGETSVITATVSPNNASNQKVIWSSSNASVASISDGTVTGISKGTAIITATADDNGKVATCSVTVNAKSEGGGNSESESATLEAVDLGLSVKWANMNLGATTPESYGDYYAWGETKTKKTYSWTNYIWCKGSNTTLTKYNTDSDYGTVDNKTRLLDEDDVAHINLGEKWRLPTKTEWDELRNSCTWRKTTHNLVTGYLITGENGNSIFLPAGGYLGTRNIRNVGRQGYYWSSTAAKHTSGVATGFQFNDKSTELRLLPTDYGCCIRAVSD